REVEVRTECELVGGNCWPSVASGLSIGSHGIHGYRAIRSGTMELLASEDFQLPTPFWEIAASSGISTCVLDVPHFRPPAARRPLKKVSYVGGGALPHTKKKPPPPALFFFRYFRAPGPPPFPQCFCPPPPR